MSTIDISIIIVTYNSEKDIYPCLKSILLSNTKFNYEIIIVDNDSKDNTCDVVREFILNNNVSNIQLLRSENNGFNAGNNIGIKSSQGNLILLLNPDTEVFTNSLDNLIKSAKKIDNLGALGCVMKDKENKEIFSAGYFPGVTNSIKKFFRKNHVTINYNEELQQVDFPSGATFLFKKAIIKQIGLMDEKYFIYYDETDYAFQMKKLGYKNYILTTTSVIHKLGNSTLQIPKFSIEKSTESFFYFINKNYNNFYGSVVKCAEFTTLFTKFILSYIFKRNKTMIIKLYLQTYIKNLIS